MSGVSYLKWTQLALRQSLGCTPTCASVEARCVSASWVAHTSLFLSRSLSLAKSLSLCLSLPLSISLSLHLSRYLAISLCLSLSLNLPRTPVSSGVASCRAKARYRDGVGLGGEGDCLADARGRHVPPGMLDVQHR